MIENRRVRFSTIEDLPRSDLGLIADIWLDDLCQAKWASREVMKVGAILIQWIRQPSPEHLELGAIETAFHVDRDDVAHALSMLKTFGMVEVFTLGEDGIRAALRLSNLQKLRVLDLKRQHATLEAAQIDACNCAAIPMQQEAPWIPQEPVCSAPVSEDHLVELLRSHLKKQAPVATANSARTA